MAIPASVIVEITPRVIASTGADAVLSGLILTKQTGYIPADSMVLRFSSQEMLGETFGTENPLYILAGYYFAGYNNSMMKPSELIIGQWAGTATSAWIKTSQTPPKIGDLQKITAGTLDIEVDGTEKKLSAIDLSDATSYSDVADTLTTAFSSAATVTYDGTLKSFVITSATTGSTSTMTYATPADTPGLANDLGTILGFVESEAPTLSSTGLDVMNASANMNAIVNKYANWAGFTTEWEPEEQEAIDLAVWSGQRPTQYFYQPWDTDKNAETQNSANLLSTAMYDENVGCSGYPTWEGYQDGGIASTTPKSAVMILGTIASIDWERTNATITMAFKSQDGIAAIVDSEEAYTNLRNNLYNFMGNYATKNAEFVFLYDGGMFGDWRFIDAYVNAIWLNNALQYQIMNGLTMTGRVPYTERGYTMIRAWIMDVVNRALNNGVIEPGVTLDNIQKQELQSEAGEDISDDLNANGYYIQVKDPSVNVRQNRESPIVTLFYTYAGSVQRISMTSTALL